MEHAMAQAGTTERQRTDRAVLSHQAFRILRDIVHARTGIYFQDAKKSLLESRVRPRLAACRCGDFEAYCDLLRRTDARHEEWRELAVVVTTNETFFYRDQAQLDMFVRTIVPAVAASRAGVRKMRVWSAACSSGDEAYTLALLMLEHPALSGWTLEVLGTDINDDVLALAAAGRYDQRAVRNVPAAMLKKYFAVDGDAYVIAPKVRSVVRFTHLNLCDRPAMLMIQGMDVIFCRNCLIYFSEEARRVILRDLARALHPQGCLVVGFSESLGDVADVFRTVHADAAVFYQRHRAAPARSCLEVPRAC
jgi:chemotaxis protein methyltransferase CheR